MEKYAKLIENKLDYYICPIHITGSAVKIDALNNGYKIFVPNYSQGSIITYIESENEIKEVRSLTFAELKQNKLNELMTYDSSGAVNIFYINGIHLWYDKSLRTSLRNAVTSFKNKGLMYFSLCLGEMIVPFEVDDLLSKLDDLEIYATNCFVQTTIHQSQIQAIENEADLLAYDFTIGYDEPLKFTI